MFKNIKAEQSEGNFIQVEVSNIIKLHINSYCVFKNKIYKLIDESNWNELKPYKILERTKANERIKITVDMFKYLFTIIKPYGIFDI